MAGDQSDGTSNHRQQKVQTSTFSVASTDISASTSNPPPPCPPLSSRQLSSLKSIIDALLPPLPPPPREKDDNEHITKQDNDAYVRFWTYDLSSDTNYLHALTTIIQTKLSHTKRLQIKIILSLLSTVCGTCLIFGTITLQPFTDWKARRDKTDGMKSLQRSHSVTRRGIFNAFKRLICAMAFSFVVPSSSSSSSSPSWSSSHPFVEDEKETEGKKAKYNHHHHRGDDEITKKANPFWEAMKYPGPYQWNISEEEDQRRMQEGGKTYDFQKEEGIILDITDEVEVECDIAIVGSGAGGGVAAQILASAGYSVVLLEKGTYLSPSHITNLESDALDVMYEKHALLTTSDANIMILAGSTLGGGTTINWSCCLKLPDYVREEWITRFGLRQFEHGKEFDTSMDAVMNTLGCTDRDRVEHNAMNRKFQSGCKAMGYDYDTTGQNLRDTGHDSAGYICFGDRYGNKRDVLSTYLVDAAKTGNVKIITNCKVDRILHESDQTTGRKKKAVGIIGHVGVHAVKVRARRSVVVAAGSLNTPTLLHRSKLRNRHIGRHLHLHPVTVAVGYYDTSEEIHGYLGAPLTTVCNTFQLGPCNDGYGTKIECPSGHTGLLAAGAQWHDPHDFKSKLLRVRNAASLIVIQRDMSEGRVMLAEDGFSPKVEYVLTEGDKRSMIDGLKGAIKILIASGAVEVGTLHNDDHGFQTRQPESSSENDASVSASRIESDVSIKSYLESIDRRSLEEHKIGVFCAHQMGSCRMSTSPNEGAIDENGETWDCDDLFVFDTSAFPSASGANPMLTVMALSHMLSTRLSLRLLYEDGKLLDKVDIERAKDLTFARTEKRRNICSNDPVWVVYWSISLIGAAVAVVVTVAFARFLVET